MSERDTFKYHLKLGNRVVHRGITNDLERRAREHQGEHAGTTITQVGRRTTREAALQWEREGGKRPWRASIAARFIKGRRNSNSRCNGLGWHYLGMQIPMYCR